MDIQNLRRKISSSKNVLLSTSPSAIQKGYLTNSSGEQVEYLIEHGLNVEWAMACEQLWTEFKVEMLNFIEQENYSEEKLSEVMKNIQTEDYHWNWIVKSHVCSSSEYEWFFLFIDNKPQGVCLIYHPKTSALHSGNIFYIEFLAVAPWNRINPLSTRVYKGVGTELIRSALNYSVNILGLHQGFSLHSLPQACGYYTSIGMINDKNNNKNDLEYFEMPESEAKNMLGVL